MSEETDRTRYTPWWTFAVVVVAALTLFGLFVQRASSAPVVQGQAQAHATRGNTVQDGKLEFAVQKVQRKVAEVGDAFYGATPTGTYTLVTMSVENTSSTAVTFDSSYVVGLDTHDHRITADRDAGFYANAGGGRLASIAPGERIQVTIAFDVANHQRIVQVQAHDSVFSRGASLDLVRR